MTSVAPINAWADKVTNGMIKQVVPPGLPFNMIITNAVYFKGMWEYAFEKDATRKQDFNAVTSSGERKVWRRRQQPVCMGCQASVCTCAYKQAHPKAFAVSVTLQAYTSNVQPALVVQYVRVQLLTELLVFHVYSVCRWCRWT